MPFDKDSVYIVVFIGGHGLWSYIGDKESYHIWAHDIAEATHFSLYDAFNLCCYEANRGNTTYVVELTPKEQFTLRLADKIDFDDLNRYTYDLLKDYMEGGLDVVG